MSWSQIRSESGIDLRKISCNARGLFPSQVADTSRNPRSALRALEAYDVRQRRRTRLSYFEAAPRMRRQSRESDRRPEERNVIAPTVRSGLRCLSNRAGPKDRNDHAGPSGLVKLIAGWDPDLTVGAITSRRFAPYLVVWSLNRLRQFRTAM